MGLPDNLTSQKTIKHEQFLVEIPGIAAIYQFQQQLGSTGVARKYFD